MQFLMLVKHIAFCFGLQAMASFFIIFPVFPHHITTVIPQIIYQQFFV
jgi:hypothetical protein